MRLQLADNGSSPRVKFLYNAKTGMAIAVPMADEPGLLSGLFKKNPRRQARRQARRDARDTRKMARITGRTTRAVNRQESKTKRQATSQQKRQIRRDTGVIRATGKQAVVQQRKQNQLDKELQRASQSPVYEPEEIDSIPSPSVPGGNYMMTPNDFMPQQDLDWTDEYDTYEMMPEDEYEDELPEDGVFYPGEDEEEFPSGELSAPFLPGLITGVKNLISKATQSGAGKIVQKGVTTGVDAYRELVRLRLENNNLKFKIRQQKTNTYLVGGAGLVGGTLIGLALSPKRKRS